MDHNSTPILFSNPKRRVNGKYELPLYEYYAGYTKEFVYDVLRYLKLSSDSVVMDPWNGSGTTTRAAIDCGYSAIGYDLNPVMVVVARAGLLDSSACGSLPSLAEDVIAKAMLYNASMEPFFNDPLHTWLTEGTSCTVRSIELAIQQLMHPQGIRRSGIQILDISTVSSLAAFFYVALFRVIKNLLRAFRGSNPTWIKTPGKDSERVNIEANVVFEMFRTTVNDMTCYMAKEGMRRSNVVSRPSVLLTTAASESLPIQNSKIDAVITSPPYCTRIDYVIATQPELAILGYSIDEMRKLRHAMTGTPTIKSNTPEPNPHWGDACLQVLNEIQRHPSKASVSYYYKHYVQYFDSIYRSLGEINRSLKEGAYCTMVVQNSYYKEIAIDLASIFVSMASNYGWSLIGHQEFATSRTLASINRRAQTYKSSRRTVETALIFRK
ncbi:hypothetical protein [Alicyclobacillus macrosporangiidus]|uniref:site-specific DNA-methyltransferase (cytosine-N(4)-specific) n=1 Tax=Alicyclobacillus macrosporangiidus TaxID=392015 RepID=A0A1I7KS33_9BACL|nr:hypothetical protein [Alicyclobacillus macrosporangiidus]SFV00263.1 DNA methylase [Alicyclobacillus macrosporangiidus]